MYVVVCVTAATAAPERKIFYLKEDKTFQEIEEIVLFLLIKWNLWVKSGPMAEK